MPPPRKAPKRRHSGPTITDVAQEAGVAIMTVSRVVNGGSYVSPATEKRVRAAIRRLGYTPNEAARMLKGQRARMIGLVVPDLADSFFATCANAVQEVAGTHGYMTLIVTSERSVERESNEIAMMAARRIAGLLIVPSREDADRRLRELQQSEIPLVAMDRTLDGVEAGQVIVENAGGRRSRPAPYRARPSPHRMHRLRREGLHHPSAHPGLPARHERGGPEARGLEQPDYGARCRGAVAAPDERS